MITDKQTIADSVEQDKPKSSGNFINILFLGLKLVTKVTSIVVKFSKFALAGISLAAYTYMYSWEFALMLMAQLLIHEYGHIWAMKRVGMKTKGIYFIPFVGGAAVASEDFKSRQDEVFVALMGPVFGFACAAAMLIIYHITKDPMYAAGASWMAMINLFNLLPINPLDGGRVMKSIAFSLHSWIGYAFMLFGIGAGIFLAIWAHIWLFILVVIVSALELAVEFYFNNKRKKDELKFVLERNALIKKQTELKEEWLNRNPVLFEGFQEPIPPVLEFVLDEIEITPEKPTMTVKQIIIAVFQYFALAILLYVFMADTMSVPGAKLAMEVLQ